MKKTLLVLLMTFMNIVPAYACGQLKDLKTNVGTISGSGTNYTITIPENTPEVTLSATSDAPFVTGYEPRTVKTDATARIRVDGESCGNGIITYTFAFKTKSNDIEIEQAIESEKTKPTETDEAILETEQIAAATVKPTVDNSIVLKSLSITGYEIEFKAKTRDYNITVPASVEKLTILPVLVNKTDSFTISENANNLGHGLNDIIITVQNKNKKVSYYTIHATRDNPSSNTNIKSIKVVGADFNFNKNVTTYAIEIDKTDSLSMRIELDDESASYKVYNNKDLTNKSEVIIRVTAQDGSTKDYKLLVNFKFEIGDYFIYIIGGAAIVIILCAIIALLLKNKKTTKKISANISAPVQTTSFNPNDAKAFANLNNATQTNGSQIQQGNINSLMSGTPMQTTSTSAPVSNANLEYITPTDSLPKPAAPNQENASEVFKL